MPVKIPKKSSRTAEIQSVDSENREIELSFSSEKECERWFGIEVLDHSKKAIRQERLKNDLAVLWNHNWDEQIGVVKEYSFENKVGRATVKFGFSAKAEEIWKDVQEGIRRHVSVGYAIHGVKLEEERDKIDVYRVTDWEPLEISLVSVPADISVGVGRSEDVGEFIEIRKDEDMPNETTTPGAIPEKPQTPVAREEYPAVDIAAERAKGKTDEQTRVKSIMEIGSKYKASQELLHDSISQGRSVEEFKNLLLEEREKSQSQPLGTKAPEMVGLTDEEARNFRFVNVINALASPADAAAQKRAAFEFEACEAAAEKYGSRQKDGFVIPNEVLLAKRDVDTTAAANLIATDLHAQSFIDLLRNKTLFLNIGSQLSGLVGDVSIPRQSSAMTGYWVAEDAEATQSDPGFDAVSLSPKTVAANTYMTRKMRQQTCLDMENFVRNDIALALANAIDYAVLYGTGASNQPTGIKNTSNIKTVDFETASKPTYAEVVDMYSELAEANAAHGSLKYVSGAGMNAHFMTTAKVSSGEILIKNAVDGSLAGFAHDITNQCASTDMFFGNWLDLIIALWGSLEIIVNPYTYSKKGGLLVSAFKDVDFAVRHPESFCYGADGAGSST